MSSQVSFNLYVTFLLFLKFRFNLCNWASLQKQLKGLHVDMLNLMIAEVRQTGLSFVKTFEVPIFNTVT